MSKFVLFFHNTFCELDKTVIILHLVKVMMYKSSIPPNIKVAYHKLPSF